MHLALGGPTGSRDAVRGLTTAASIWLTAAVGAAAGPGLVLPALLGTLGHFASVLVLPRLATQVTRRVGSRFSLLRVHDEDGRGLLRDVLAQVTGAGFVVTDMTTTRADDLDGTGGVEVLLHLDGRGDLDGTLVAPTEMRGVLAVTAGDTDE